MNDWYWTTQWKSIDEWPAPGQPIPLSTWLLSILSLPHTKASPQLSVLGQPEQQHRYIFRRLPVLSILEEELFIPWLFQEQLALGNCHVTLFFTTGAHGALPGWRDAVPLSSPVSWEDEGGITAFFWFINTYPLGICLLNIKTSAFTE